MAKPRVKKASVREHYKGKDFASVAKSISDKYPSRDTDPMQQRAFMEEINQLMKIQEAQKAAEVAMQTIGKNRRPANASQYAHGGYLEEMAGGGPVPGFNPMSVLSMAMRPAFNKYLVQQFEANPSQSQLVMEQAFKAALPMGAMPPKAPEPGIPPSANVAWGAPNAGGYQFQNVPKKIAEMPMLPTQKLPQSIPTRTPRVAPLEPVAERLNPINPLPKSVQSMNAGPPQLGVSPTPVPAPGEKGPNWLKDNIYAPVAIGKALEMAGKVGMLATGYDKLMPESNPYESEIRQILSGRSVNLDQARQDVLAQQNAAMETPVRSSSVRAALGQNIYSQGMDQLGRLSSEQQRINAGLAGENAQMLNSLGQQKAAARVYAEQQNNMGQQAQDAGIMNILESVGNVGQRLTDYRANVAQQQMLGAALSTADFKFGDVAQMIKDGVAGKQLDPDDAIKIVQSSSGKSRDQIMQEIEQAKQKFNTGVTQLNQ